MAQTRVNPTRMELLRLKKRTQLAKKGHKLLKEKRDGLMQEFMRIVREAKTMREEVDAELATALRHFVTAQAVMTPQAVEMVKLLPMTKADVDVETKNVMGVTIPEFNVSIEESETELPTWETSPELKVGMTAFQEVLPKLLRLAAIEKSAQLLAQEIEKTRRRVNALEHVLIPQLTQTTRYIRMKLDEQERGAIVTTMAIKANM